MFLQTLWDNMKVLRKVRGRASAAIVRPPVLGLALSGNGEGVSVGGPLAPTCLRKFADAFLAHETRHEL